MIAKELQKKQRERIVQTTQIEKEKFLQRRRSIQAIRHNEDIAKEVQYRMKMK